MADPFDLDRFVRAQADDYATALAVEGKSARDVFGSPDDLKLRSCATLFAHVSPAGSAFHRLLDKYYGGTPDNKTLQLIGAAPAAE